MPIATDRPTLEVMYTEYMIKIGKEKRIRYHSSSIEDLFICIEIEHDGVFDYAMIDLLNGYADMRIYDKYNFIVTEHVKIPIVEFTSMINDMSMYDDMLLSYLADKE